MHKYIIIYKTTLIGAVRRYNLNFAPGGNGNDQMPNGRLGPRRTKHQKSF